MFLEVFLTLGRFCGIVYHVSVNCGAIECKVATDLLEMWQELCTFLLSNPSEKSAGSHQTQGA